MLEETVYPSAIGGFSLMPYLLYGGLALLLFIGLVVLVFWIKRRISRPELYGLSRQEVARRWERVRETSRNGEMGMKLALVEADVLLDSALKSLVIPGDTLGERLKAACYTYPKLRDVWWAHKLRNRLVHDAMYRFRSGEGRRALDAFERALKVLNVL